MKARFTLTATLEVELDNTLYGEPCISHEKMLEHEIQQLNEDPDMFWEIHDSKGTGLKVTGELLK